MSSLAAQQSSGNPFASYGNVALAGSGKKGILKKLDNDYREIILGGIAAVGNGGWIYDERTAKQYMESDREFMEMVANGRLRSEWGHPVRVPGMSDHEWFARICSIYEPNISSHIRRISLSYNTVTDAKGRKIVAVIGEVRASGPKADEFRRWLDNPDEDVTYSIRSFARKDFNTMRKHITKIITWDSVFDPGIREASKYKTPSLECKDYIGRELDQHEFNLARMQEAVEARARNDESFEHQNQMQIITDLKKANKQIIVPTTFRW